MALPAELHPRSYVARGATLDSLRPLLQQQQQEQALPSQLSQQQQQQLLPTQDSAPGDSGQPCHSRALGNKRAADGAPAPSPIPTRQRQLPPQHELQGSPPGSSQPGRGAASGPAAGLLLGLVVPAGLTAATPFATTPASRHAAAVGSWHQQHLQQQQQQHQPQAPGYGDAEGGAHLCVATPDGTPCDFHHQLHQHQHHFMPGHFDQLQHQHQLQPYHHQHQHQPCYPHLQCMAAAGCCALSMHPEEVGGEDEGDDRLFQQLLWQVVGGSTSPCPTPAPRDHHHHRQQQQQQPPAGHEQDGWGPLREPLLMPAAAAGCAAVQAAASGGSGTPQLDSADLDALLPATMWESHDEAASGGCRLQPPPVTAPPPGGRSPGALGPAQQPMAWVLQGSQDCDQRTLHTGLYSSAAWPIAAAGSCPAGAGAQQLRSAGSCPAGACHSASTAATSPTRPLVAQVAPAQQLPGSCLWGPHEAMLRNGPPLLLPDGPQQVPPPCLPTTQAAQRALPSAQPTAPPQLLSALQQQVAALVQGGGVDALGLFLAGVMRGAAEPGLAGCLQQPGVGGALPPAAGGWQLAPAGSGAPAGHSGASACASPHTPRAAGSAGRCADQSIRFVLRHMG